MFIELHDKSGKIVYVNPNHIVAIEMHGTNGSIAMSDGTSMIVEENIHEIVFRADPERRDLA